MPRPLLVSLMIALGLTTWVLGAMTLDRYGQRAAPPGDWDAIVVAGCRVTPDGQASPALQRRTEAAVDLWRQGLAPTLVFTGGVGQFQPAEARAAADHARSLGVPDAAILTEERSTSTEENAMNAADMLPGARILVVSDAYHVFRVERVFGRYFPEVRGVGSLGRVGNRVRGSMREVLAVSAYWVFGRL